MNLDLKLDWLVAGSDVPELRQSMAMLELCVGDTKLTQHEDLWSQTVRDAVLVSAYPLAQWIAASWWRLNWEPLPSHIVRPRTDWRMAHELGAANHGFVWPQIMFASDCEVMQVWAVPSGAVPNQSVRYLNGLSEPACIELSDFRRSMSGFIEAVICRLDAVGVSDSDLAQLWAILQEEQADPESARYRQIEAEMGFDPDECPEEIMRQALSLDASIGTSTLTELAPIYGRTDSGTALELIEKMRAGDGIIGTPRSDVLKAHPRSSTKHAPWRQAVDDARALRQTIGNSSLPVNDQTLYELLGLSTQAMEQWSPASLRSSVGVAIPEKGAQFKFMPRKRHPVARRFELSRFLGDYLQCGTGNGGWLTSTDLGTARQKYQRAFAAEFLCPIGGLRDYLQDDFTESALEDAAENFHVSPETVRSMLANNGMIPVFSSRYAEPSLPYQSAY